MRKLVTLVFTFFLYPCAAMAENSDEWQVDVKAYLFGTSISGTAGLGQVDADLDLSFSDIMDNLEGGIMGGVEARKNDWMVIIDGAYLQMSDKGTLGSNGALSATVDATLRQTILEGFVGYRLTESGAGGESDPRFRADALAGLRYNNIRTELSAEASVLGLTTSASRKKTGSWVDPVIGLRLEFEPIENFELVGFGDIGGFSIGSDLTWQLALNAIYRWDNGLSIFGGYRVLYIDYTDGSGSDRFKFDATYSGPFLGVGYRF